MSSVNESEIGFKWERPEDDGGSEIIGYVVEQRESFGFSYSNIGMAETEEFLAKRLREGAQYVFRVAAENEVGVGEFEELTESVQAKSPHGEFQRPFRRSQSSHCSKLSVFFRAFNCTLRCCV